MVKTIMTTEFILMLTHHDVTVPNALDLFQKVSRTGVKCAGCKDIGLEISKLRQLFSNMKSAGMKSFLEVVTMKEEEHFRGVDVALDIGAGFLIGGMPQYTEKTIQYLKSKKNPPKFFPYIGKIVGHPCLLRGTLEEIVEDAKRTQKLGADGINLLAYRYDGDVQKLIQKVTETIEIPLIVAGNVDSLERIRELKELGVWAFTIGGAIMERKFLTSVDESEQIRAVLREIAH
jgi:hypothetical protein